jgi:heparin binding hemagglutinin HbhA
MPNTADVRKTVTGQGRAVLEDARKPLYAFLGAGDLVLARASQLRELPGDTQTAMDGRVREVRTRIEDLRADLRHRLAELLSRAESLQDRAPKPAELRSMVEKYLERARETYEDLAERGEKVVSEAATRPGVKRVLDRAESLLDRTGDTVDAAAAGVQETVEAATKPKAPARKTAVRRTPAN